MPYLELNTHRIFYQEHNPKGLAERPLLLLHGLGSSGEDWPLQLPYFTLRFPVLTVDLRGHGRSTMSKGWPLISDFAADVARVLQAVDRPNAHVMGLSLGGVVALQLALEVPECVHSLTIINAFARFQLGKRSMVRTIGRFGLLGLGRMDWLGAWIAAGIFPHSDQVVWRQAAASRIAENSRSSYLRTIRAISRIDIRDRLGEIRAPSLIIAGEEDTTVTLQAKLNLAEGISGARFVRFPESGHGTPYDAADRLNDVVMEFLLSIEGC